MRLVPFSPLDDDEATWLFALRNDPAVVATSLSGREIAWADHQAWLGILRANPDDRRVYLATVGDERVGMVRLDRDTPDCAEISLAIVPAWRGKGLAAEMITRAVALGVARDIVHFSARVRYENIASHRAFLRAGFTPFATVSGATSRCGWIGYRRSV